MTAPFNPAPSAPTKPSAVVGARPGSQASKRFTDTLWDQHKHPVKFPRGRPFCGQREYAATPEVGHQAGFVSGELQPGEFIYSTVTDTGWRVQSNQDRLDSLATAWSAPWVPISKYFKFDYHRMRITIEYQRMIADEMTALGVFWDAAAELAGEGETIDPDHPNKVPFRIRRLIGNPFNYLNKIKIAQAAQAGDPWLLGFTDTPNEQLAKCLGKRVRFIGGDANKLIADNQHVITDLPPEPAPLLEPQQVLGTPQADLMKLVAELTAKVEALSAKKEKQKASIAKARAARKGKDTTAPAEVA